MRSEDKVKGPVLNAIPANVVVLGFVSFFTDISSDMIYPLLPVFLVQYLGAGQGFIGLIEGFAESTAAFFTLFSGVWADRLRDRSKLVLGGYTLSSFFRPLAAIAWSPWVIFFTRFADRMGKGIRTAPRDALIADSVDPRMRGRAFGLQRSMDHAGAVFGPVIATILLATVTQNLRVVFALAAIPALMAVALILWKVREVKRPEPPPAAKISLSWPRGRLRIYLAILFLFILSCSSDAFLLLRVGQLGVPTALLPLIWMMFNMVKAISTLPFGALSDRWGRRRMILAGWIVYTLVYIGFGMATQVWHAWVLFAAYGFFYGLTEGSERAILADYADPQERGQAFGWYSFTVGLAAFPASLIFGALWQAFGARTAFLTSASISAAASFFLLLFLWRVPSPKAAAG